MDAIVVNNLTKKYSGRTAADHLSFRVKQGEVFGLLGANGAGKSTTLECILGTRQMDSGEVAVLGYDPKKDRRSLFQHVGVQFQSCEYQPEIKVSELCEETACLYHHPADWKELCIRFGIGDKFHHTVKNLSGGERQRLFIVLALIPNPQLVFLDELTAGLDTRARRGVWNILSDLKRKGLTIVLTSHYMDEVEALCDKICILKQGKAVFYGTVAEAKKISSCEKFEDAYLVISGEEEEA